jgi:hypothetical protein
MRVKSLSIVLALTVILSTSAFARVQQKQIEPRDPELNREINPIEWVVRAVRKVVRALEQPILPIPVAPTTTT